MSSSISSSDRSGLRYSLGLDGCLVDERLLLQYHLPAMAGQPELMREGSGLISYSGVMAEIDRRRSSYVDRILRGAKPGDLPVEQPTQFEMVINLKTAKLLGLAIPQSIMLRADEVIR